MTFSRVSVAAYTTEPDHFYVNITETWSCMFPPRFRNTETCDFVLLTDQNKIFMSKASGFLRKAFKDSFDKEREDKVTENVRFIK